MAVPPHGGEAVPAAGTAATVDHASSPAASTDATIAAASEPANAVDPSALADVPAGAQPTAAAAGEAAEAATAEAGSTAATAIPEPQAEPEPDLPGQLPGELLAARRIEMRLSIDELASRVKLAPRQLIALEANDFGSLPGMATTRGFIRSCAKTMGMDPEPLLAMLAQEPNPALGPMVMRRPLPQPGFNGRRYAPSTSHRRSANKLSGMAAVVLIFVGMLSYIAWRNDWLQLPDLDWSSARDAVLPSSMSSPAGQQAQDAQAPAAETTEAPAASTAEAPKASAPKAVAPADAEVYAPAAPAPVAAATTAAAASSAKAEPAKAAPAASVDPARALELKLREDAWVEVMTQNGERKLVSRLMKAGSTERIQLNEPVILVVGNAAGVDVTLRGQPVNLKPGTRDNVAKLNLK